MSKFNNSSARARAGVGPVKSVPTSNLLTHEGATGFARDAKSELFLAAISDFGGEGTFYESASVRTERLKKLTHEVAVQDAT